jgi:hypothetical protein
MRDMHRAHYHLFLVVVLFSAVVKRSASSWLPPNTCQKLSAGRLPRPPLKRLVQRETEGVTSLADAARRPESLVAASDVPHLRSRVEPRRSLGDHR